MDPQLLSLVSTGKEYDQPRCIDNLMQRGVTPLVTLIVQKTLHVSLHQSTGPQTLAELDAQDVYGQIQAQMAAVLQTIASRRRSNIRDLGNYTATVAHYAINKHLAQQHPERNRLRVSLRRLMETSPHFDLWTGDAGTPAQRDRGRSLCGLRGWQATCRRAERSAALIQLRENPVGFARRHRIMQSATEMPLDQLVETIFGWIDHPIPFRDLLAIVALLREVTTPVRRADPSRDDPESTLPELQDPSPSTEAQAALRDYLLRLWVALCELKPRSCAVFLLGTDDHLPLQLQMCGIAGLDECARAMNIPASELRALWTELPLKDMEIGEYLGMTPQQVAELRRAARDKLARQMKE